LAVAVSGGGDSMALLLAVAETCGPHHLTALTVDHALRPTAAAEARQVKRWCKVLGIKHVTLKWHHGPVTSGIQAKARAARYDLMASWCRKHDVPCLLTAHTKDDQAETVAMRQARTTSAKSLAAIWPEVKVQGLTILRPLLTKSRRQLRNFLLARDQPWLEDPSNQDPRFERVRLRQNGVAAGLAKSATAAQRETRAQQAAAKNWLVENLRQDASGMVMFSTSALAKLEAAASDTVLIHILEILGGKAPDLARRTALLNWLQKPDAPRRSLGGAIFAVRKSLVIAGREPARIATAPLKLSPLRPKLWDGRFAACGPAGSTITSKSQVKTLKRIKYLPAFVDQGLPVILLDNEILATPFSSHHPQAKLTLRTK
jgi:tRNA(Ile)-lysidine synthase